MYKIRATKSLYGDEEKIIIKFIINCVWTYGSSSPIFISKMLMNWIHIYFNTISCQLQTSLQVFFLCSAMLLYSFILEFESSKGLLAGLRAHLTQNMLNKLIKLIIVQKYTVVVKVNVIVENSSHGLHAIVYFLLMKLKVSVRHASHIFIEVIEDMKPQYKSFFVILYISNINYY